LFPPNERVDETTAYFIGRPIGVEPISNTCMRQYPELVFDVKGIIVEGERAAVHWTNRGTSRKKEPYENEGVTLLEWEQDGFRFMSDFFKDTEEF
jgi:hypothetical protein